MRGFSRIFFYFLFFADVYFISRGCFFMLLFLRISFLADSRKFYSLIFADVFLCFFMFFYVFFLRISFLADFRGFSRIFADFISRRLSQILSADFRGWFSFLADFFYVFNLYFYEISIWIFWVIRLVDPKHGIQFFVSYVFDIVSVPNRHVYIGWF